MQGASKRTILEESSYLGWQIHKYIDVLSGKLETVAAHSMNVLGVTNDKKGEPKEQQAKIESGLSLYFSPKTKGVDTAVHLHHNEERVFLDQHGYMAVQGIFARVKWDKEVEEQWWTINFAGRNLEVDNSAAFVQNILRYKEFTIEVNFCALGFTYFIFSLEGARPIVKELMAAYK